MTYRDRRRAHADRLRHWARKRHARSDAAFESARRLADAIPLGQPILVGHHSERRARGDAERIHHNMSRGVEHQRLATGMTSRADEVERQAEHAIYSDDVDVIERLQEKIASLEAERERIKAINACVRKHGLGALQTHLDPPATDAEISELIELARLCPYHAVEQKGFPSYKLQNLGGNITRARQRLQCLNGGASIGTTTRPVLTRPVRAHPPQPRPAPG
jgi:hypothetical protein